MRDPIENVTRLQKQLNNLQLENQVLKNILDKAGLSYQNELASIRKRIRKRILIQNRVKGLCTPKRLQTGWQSSFLILLGKNRCICEKKCK